MGFALMIQMAAANTILQAVVHDEKRGRVMSLFSMAFLGTAPIGSLICGALSNQFGFSNTIFGCGVYCLIVAVIWAIHLPSLQVASRALYIEKGLLVAEEEVPHLT